MQSILSWSILNSKEPKSMVFKDYVKMILYFSVAICLVFMVISVVLHYCRLVRMRRRIAIRRHIERVPQRRRPGAVFRDHQIFRKIMLTARHFIGQDPVPPKNDNNSNNNNNSNNKNIAGAHETVNNVSNRRRRTLSANNNNTNDDNNGEGCLLRRTRSGAIYGQYNYEIPQPMDF